MMATHLVHGGRGITRGDIVWCRTAYGISVPALAICAPFGASMLNIRPFGILRARSAGFGLRPGEWMWRQCDLVASDALIIPGART